MNNKMIKTLIPVIAVVIIFESIMLVSNLEKSSISSLTTKEAIPTVVMTEGAKKEEDSLVLNLLSENKEMKIGKKYKISVNLTPKTEFNLNALDLFVKFDPEMVTISDLVSTKELVKPDFIKVSDKKSVIVANFLFTAKDGIAFTKDKQVEVLTFNAIPKKAGMADFEISTGDSDGDSVTMFVDKVTSKGLPFSSSKLEINFVN